MPTSRQLAPERPRGIGPGEALLHTLALTSLAIAEPLLDLLGRFAEFLVAHRMEGGSIVLLAGGLALAPPVLSWTLWLLARWIHRAIADWFHLGVVSLLIAAWLLQLLARGAGLPAVIALPAAFLGGLSAAHQILRRERLRALLSLAAVGSLFFPAHLLLLTPAARLLHWSSYEVETTSGEVSDVPLVLVVFDELPVASLLAIDGTIDGERFPHFAALAEDAVFYRNATAVASATAHAVPAILTGRYPGEPLLPTYLDYPDNLFTLLAGSHSIHAAETLTNLCPRSVCASDGADRAVDWPAVLSDLRVLYLHLLLPPELAPGLPPVGGTWRDFGTKRRRGKNRGVAPVERSERMDIPGLFERFVSALDGNRKTLHYLHLELPHIPWRYLPSGTEYGPVSRSNFTHGLAADATWKDDDWLITQGLQRHLAQTAYADQLLGRLVEILRARGLWDDVALVVTADHGLAFMVGEPGRAPNEANAGEVAAVPLFLRAPGIEPGTVSDDPVEVVDVLPTLAESAGIEVPWPIDGRSLLDPTYRGRSHKMLTFPEEGVRMVLAAESIPAWTRTAIERIAAKFPEPGIDGLFRIGPHVELIGRSVLQLEQTAAANLQMALDQPWFYDKVDPESSFVPGQVVGRFLELPSARGHVPVAVAVNGTIRAMTRSHEERGVERFAALLPEGSLEAGRNEVEVFVVEESASGLRLLPVTARSGPSYELERGATGSLVGIKASNGTGCQLTAAAATGEVFRDGLTFWGWALDPTGASSGVVIMAFVDGRLVWAGSTGAPPSESFASHDLPGFDASGFQFGLTRPLLPRGESSEIHLFAVLAQRCTLLPISG